MDTNKKVREHISALSDGALHPDDLELALAALLAADGRNAWEVYHRIGDVLRAEASPDLSPEFSDRLAARLAAEPTHAKRVVAAEAKPAVAASASAT
jgi:sigma-E factor negative regulatory protein RseA